MKACKRVHVKDAKDDSKLIEKILLSEIKVCLTEAAARTMKTTAVLSGLNRAQDQENQYKNDEKDICHHQDLYIWYKNTMT